MVTRKPVGPPVNTAQASQSQPPRHANDPPYPATPIDSSKIPASVNSIYSPTLDNSPAFDLIDMDEARRRPQRRDSDVSSHGTWDSDDDNDDRKASDDNDVPKPLRISPSKQHLQGAQEEGDRSEGIPAALRPGPAGGQSSPRMSQETGQPQYQAYHDDAQANPWASEQQADGLGPRVGSNNPYLRNQQTGSSQAAWAEPAAPPPAPPMNAPPAPPPVPSAASPVELPTAQTPADELSKLSFNDRSEREEPYHTAEVMNVPHQGQPPLPPVVEQRESGASSLDPWAGQQPTPEQKWDDTPIAPPPGPPPGQAPSQQPSLIDDAAPNFLPPVAESAPQPEPPKPAPSPISTSQPPPARSTDSIPETPGTRAKRQRNEFYQIKHVNWLDESSPQSSNMRRSPILTQNANGPCPLLALVNALVLSTPQTHHTALIETLRSREQVSLGLLLDAVFDELMSGRRGETASSLPDVSELYAFLLALHTGMNVNPRFVTLASTPRGSLDGHPPGLDGVHPMHRAQSKAGCFEETREMRLYSTFSIPLMHGWVPPRDSPAYAAFERSAQTFEDAQNIQFLEPELEDKLRTEGLSEAETQTLQDIASIKAFLDTWRTQLTEYGLQGISQTLRAGQIAILFRNDHFSTVYKEPRRGGLMTLVTDAGYSGHEEIVWESLVDVHGAGGEMFSGDFRGVSHGQDARFDTDNSGGGSEEWLSMHGTDGTSVDEQPPDLPGRRPSSHQPTARTNAATDVPAETPPAPGSKTREQEDHDMALALQLQEEEEARQRQSESQRRREQELSEQFLSRENEGRPPAIPPRRGGGRGGGGTGRRASRGEGGRGTGGGGGGGGGGTGGGGEEAPPTYEESSHDRPYREAGSTAPVGQGNPLGTYDALRRQASGNAVGGGSGGGGGGRGRRSSVLGRRTSQPGVPGGYQSGVPLGAGRGRGGGGGGQGAPGVQEAEERCSVM